MKRFLPLLLLLTQFTSLWSQSDNDPNEGMHLTQDLVEDTFSLSWWGHPSRTYFIQQSEDLIHWNYIPVIEAGQNKVIEWGFATNADKLFLRLKYTDIVTADPFNDDFDSDGISNIHELTAPAEISLDPLEPDSNSDGTPDGLEDTDGDFMLNGEELAHGLNPLLNDAMLDMDGDGYPNIYELRGLHGDPSDPSKVPAANFTVASDGSGNYTTLLDAIYSATEDYSVILVKPGTYLGNKNSNFYILYDHPSILLISEEGAEVTVLDGEGTQSGVEIYNTHSALVGFTIQNCRMTTVLGGTIAGGAIQNISGNRNLLKDCIIYNNSTNYNGGGICITGDNNIVESCEIYGNYGGTGGGVFVDGSGNTFLDCNIFENFGDSGAGISVKGDNTKIEQCSIYRNASSSSTYDESGSGVFISGSSSTISACEIYENRSNRYGGGIRYFSAADAMIINTSIYRNSAMEKGLFSYGGGIYVNYTSTIELIHVTLNENSAWKGNEIFNDSGSTTPVTLTNTIVWNRHSSDNVLYGVKVNASHSIIQGTSGYIDNGNVSNTDPNLSYFGLLTQLSEAAIDSGAETETDYDIQGELRPFGLGSDIGADEFIDVNGDGWPEALEDLYQTNVEDDLDEDGLLNLFEYENGLDLDDPNMDGDRLNDGYEVLITGTDPLTPDTDEIDIDFNQDGIDDSIGLSVGIDFDESNNDGDGLNNTEELALGTNPTMADTDGDGVDDGVDEFPLDPDLSTRAIDGEDVTPPAIQLQTPPQATLL